MEQNVIRKPLAAIRAKCLECCVNDEDEVEQCVCVDCVCFPFRFGENPFKRKEPKKKEKK